MEGGGSSPGRWIGGLWEGSPLESLAIVGHCSEETVEEDEATEDADESRDEGERSISRELPAACCDIVKLTTGRAAVSGTAYPGRYGRYAVGCGQSAG